ncbi:MAG: 50S ribosomal protein L23 [archaeon]|nr:50S ribosomal protein L23 [archaeon]
MNASSILIRPVFSEKAMSVIGVPAKDSKSGNKIEFIVHRNASKLEIKTVFEERFEVKIKNIRTKIQKDGKHAIIKLTDDYSAEDVGMKVGIF